MVQYENEICQYLGIPSIPKRKWDGKQSFLRGCATIVHDDGSKSYAVATFDNEQHNEPRILKVFSLERYVDVHEIFVVPPYMDTNVDDMDLDEESKTLTNQRMNTSLTISTMMKRLKHSFVHITSKTRKNRKAECHAPMKD